MKSGNTGSYFDSLWCESSVDVVDEHVFLFLCQIQPIQYRGITASHKEAMQDLKHPAEFNISLCE